MSDTTTRALTLLNLLQTHRHWPAAGLAGRLGVTERTVRRDVERLRELGYRIDSVPGLHGGYRLAAGTSMPPLLLSDDEAVVMAVGLRLIASGRIARGAESAVSALVKLEQVLPRPLRRRVRAITDAVAGSEARSDEVSVTVLTELALACRDHERVHLDYRPGSGEPATRRVEPYALAPAGQDWYLVCWDLDRADWRTFRIDRIAAVTHTQGRFVPRPLTTDEIAEMVAVACTWQPHVEEAAAIVDLPIERFRDLLGAWAAGATAAGEQHTRWPVGASTVRDTVYALTWLPPDAAFALDMPAESRAALRRMLTDLLDAVDADPAAGCPAHRADP